MSLFSRRSMIAVAGCALVLPLAAGTANAAFDIGGDDAAAVEDLTAEAEGSASSDHVSGSVESTPGSGAAQAGKDGVRMKACAAAAKPCAQGQISDLEGHGANASGRVSDNGASVRGTLRAADEKLSSSASATTDGGSTTVDTPFGNGSGAIGTDGTASAQLGSRFGAGAFWLSENGATGHVDVTTP